jgi:hypothetical protein
MSRAGNIPGNLIVQQMLANYITEQWCHIEVRKAIIQDLVSISYFICSTCIGPRCQSFFYNQDGRRWSQRNAGNRKSEARANCSE